MNLTKLKKLLSDCHHPNTPRLEFLSGASIDFLIQRTREELDAFENDNLDSRLIQAIQLLNIALYKAKESNESVRTEEGRQGRTGSENTGTDNKGTEKL